MRLMLQSKWDGVSYYIHVTMHCTENVFVIYVVTHIGLSGDVTLSVFSNKYPDIPRIQKGVMAQSMSTTC